jgi:RHS repeat-associated protein
VGVEHALKTPSGAVQQSASGSSSGGFIRLDLAPHTPAEYGTWTHEGTYQQITHEWSYEWNDWTQSYDGYYLGAWPSAFGGASPQAFVPEPPPVISLLSPDAGPIGTPVTISGSYFGSSQGTVTFHNGVGAPVYGWTPTSIQVGVPDGAVTGPVVVTRAGGPSSTGNPTFTVTPPPPSPESVHYVHLDALGSVRMITDSSGQVVGRSNFVPFGQDWEPSGLQEDRRFAMLERTDETGSGSWLALDYAGARYYHSQTGRFTTPDDSIYIDPLNPQTWNLYAYALNNPLRWVDPSGRQAECATDICVTVTPDDGMSEWMRDAIKRAHAITVYLGGVASDILDLIPGTATVYAPEQGPNGPVLPPPRDPTLNPYLMAGVGLVVTRRVPGLPSNWGRNRIVKELHDRGFILAGRTRSGNGMLYRHPQTGEELRIMPRPSQRFRNDPPAKHEADYYYRYRTGVDQPWGSHVSIPNK